MENELKYYMDFALCASMASTAKRNKVGCVIVKDRNIIGMGFNGTPSGFSNECEFLSGNEWMTKPEVLHAESNALMKCAQSTLSSTDATMFVTTAPCFDCAKLIIQAGIRKVYFLYAYRNNDGINLLRRAGIEFEQL